jgi:hypothetical protein
MEAWKRISRVKVDVTIKVHVTLHVLYAIWLVIQAVSVLYPPISIANIFKNWVHGIDYKYITLLRASIISPSQLAIRFKILFLCLVGRERRGERRRVGSHARASSNTCS